MLLALLATTPEATSAPLFTSKDALGPLLSAESLLFGTLNVALALAAPSAWGRGLGFRPRTLAHWAAALVSVMAAGAGLAWVDLFIIGDFPEGWAIPPVALLAIGIAVQPIFAWLIARNVERPPMRVE